jgi:hypothetical protein
MKAISIPKGVVPVIFGCFWRNDLPKGQGIGFIVREQVPQFVSELERMMLVYDESVPDPAELVEQLADWALNWDKLQHSYYAVAAANIYWLETRGHLAIDDFNGCQIVCADRPLPESAIVPCPVFVHLTPGWTPPR